MTILSKIIPIRALKDNYIWLFFDEETQEAWVVDPGDASPVEQILNQLNLSLSGMLITHHHYDHSGGVKSLLLNWPKATVISSHKSPLGFITQSVREGNLVQCGKRQFKVLEIPGHTLDHIAFVSEDILFCGDTLFSVGCGKVFEGTPEQMYYSLNKLSQLSQTTKIFCGHEYTLANLKFAQLVEPHNPNIINKINEVMLLHEENQPTLPALLHLEKLTNPFLRCEEMTVKHAAEHYAEKKLNHPVQVFATLRAWKNAI